VEEQTNANGGALLSSWKEIAAYLGVTVRTAQKWEIQRGLPVRRLPGGRGRVVASVCELSAWVHSTVSPGTQLASTRSPHRWVWLLVGAVVLAAAAGTVKLLSSNGTAASWRLAGDSLVVVDVRGRELWRRSFGFPLADYGQLAGQQLGWIGDVDGDGAPEVLFAAVAKPGGQSAVFCFSDAGQERWRFVPGASAASFPQSYRPPYYPLNLLVFRSGGAVRIAVAGVHHTWFPCQIALLAGDGRLLREYWHAGHIPVLAFSDLAGSGRPVLYAGGMANGYNRGALVALDPESFGGVSREETAEYQLPGAAAREISRVLFPRTCINLGKEPYNGVGSLEVTPDGLIVGVREEMSQPTMVIHTFGADGRYLGAGFSSRFEGRHRELERTKLLDHPLDRERETAHLTAVEWLTKQDVPGVQTSVRARSRISTFDYPKRDGSQRVAPERVIPRPARHTHEPPRPALKHSTLD